MKRERNKVPPSQFAVLCLVLNQVLGRLQDVQVVSGLRPSSTKSIIQVVDNFMVGQKGIVVSTQHYRMNGGIGLPVYTSSTPLTDDEQLIEGYVLDMSSQNMKLESLGSKKVVILYRGIPDPQELINIFRLYWQQLRTPNLILLTIFLNWETTGEEKVYLYNPFRQTVAILPTDADVNSEIGKSWSDMNGYPLRVAIASTYLGWSQIRNEGKLQGNGLDGPYLYELKRKMNFTLERITVPDGGVGTFDVKKGAYTGVLKELVEGNVDLSINARFIKWYHTTKIVFTGAVYDETVCVVVKSSEEIRGWDVFLRIFQWEVWAVILAVAVVVNYILSWMRRVEQEEKYSVSSTLPTTLRAMFMIPMTEMPKTTAQRLTTGACLFVGIVIVTTFQAELFNFVKNRTTYKEVDTLFDLYDTGMKIITRSTMKDTFDGFREPRLKALGTRLVINEGLLKPQWFDDKAVLVRMREYTLMEETGRMDYGFDLHVVEQCPRKYNLGYVFPRSSPFVDQIERNFTSRVFEAALLERWYRETIGNERDVVRMLKYTRKLKSVPDLRELSTKDLEVGLFSLLLGYGISIICFLGEILFGAATQQKNVKCKKKCKNRLQFVN